MARRRGGLNHRPQGCICAETLVAPGGKLGQRHRVFLAAGNILHSTLSRVTQLLVDHARKIARMQSVPNLIAMPSEAKVL